MLDLPNSMGYWADITLGDVLRSTANPVIWTKVAVLVLAVGATRLYFGQSVPTAIAFQWPAPKEAELQWEGRVIENPDLAVHERDKSLLPQGAEHAMQKRQYITCYDPSTAYHLATIPLLTGHEIQEQIKRAHLAQPVWKKTTFAQRKLVLNSLRAWVLRDMDAICRVACRDTGKTRVDAVLGEIMTTMEKIDWLLKYGEKTLAPSSRPSPMLLAHKVSTVHYEPLGLVAALVSWNYSFHNLISPILAALFAGNTIVVKCSEQVAWSSIWYIGGIKACLRACGMDEDVVQLVICLPDLAETVTKNELVRHITFIGSEPVGKKVASAAAEMMIPTCIELGGKDPAFLLPSADIDFFASTLLRGVYQSAGQNCIGIELIVLPRTLLPRFLSLVENKIRALRPSKDVSSLISQQPIPRLEKLLAKAVSEGAKLIHGGKRFNHPDRPHGAYFTPTLVVDVTMDMDIAKEELFAPVMSVVGYETVDEAIGWLNASRFGLGASVFGNDKKECQGVASRLECGMVSISDFVGRSRTLVRCDAKQQGVFYLNQAMPFGGVKASGHGRFGGEEGLRSLCTPKSIIHDRLFSLIRTPIPKVVDFPLPDPIISWGFLHGLVWTAYGGLSQKVRGVGELVKASLA